MNKLCEDCEYKNVCGGKHERMEASADIAQAVGGLMHKHGQGEVIRAMIEVLVAINIDQKPLLNLMEVIGEMMPGDVRNIYRKWVKQGIDRTAAMKEVVEELLAAVKRPGPMAKA